MDKKKEDTSLSDKLLDEPYKLSDLHGSSKSFVMKKLMCVLLVCLTFMAVEVVGGILASSIAILSDAAHLLSDVLGFVISMISVYISGLPASTRHSYGFHRAGVIGALASVVLIWGLTGFLIYFATVRIIEIDSIEIDGEIMFGTATFGLLANLVMIKVLHGHGHGHSHDHGHDHGHSHGHSHGKHDHSGSPYITHVRKSQIKPITSNVVNNLHDQGHEERSHSQSHSHDEEEQGHSPDLEKRAHSDDHSQEEHKHDNEQEFSPQSGLMVEDVEHENHVDTVIIKEEDIRCPCDDFSPTRSHTEDRGTKENGERNVTLYSEKR
jgi:cation diffusion facilitator family transporter